MLISNGHVFGMVSCTVQQLLATKLFVIDTSYGTNISVKSVVIEKYIFKGETLIIL